MCNYTCPLHDAHSCVVAISDNEPIPSFLGSGFIMHLPPQPEPAVAKVMMLLMILPLNTHTMIANAYYSA